MVKRKPLSQSLRWQVFARDGFICRYCGAQAGEDGVSLCVDHIVSIADGGDNAIDNLATACRSCNSGKSARSLSEAPAAKDVIKRIKSRGQNLKKQADAINESILAKQELRQQIVNMKCAAYEANECQFGKNEEVIVANLCKEFGADKVLEWYESASMRNVTQWNAAKYVCGCARKTREAE